MTAGLAPCRKISSGNPPTPLRPLRYRGDMVPSREDDVVVPFPITRQERARQWRRTAWAMAALFASLPIACKIFVGTWGFDEAFEVTAVRRSRHLFPHPQPQKPSRHPG